MSRFALQWLLPDQCDRLTHVMLLDRERPAPYLLAVSHGVDREDSLQTLLGTLIENGAMPEAIDFVSLEYTRRTGKAPGIDSLNRAGRARSGVLRPATP